MNSEDNMEDYLEFLDEFDGWESMFVSIAEICEQGVEFVPALINRLKRNGLKGRRSTYRILLTLFLIRDKRTASHIMDWLETGSQPLDSVAVACHTLGVLEDPAAVPSLINVIKLYGGNRLGSERFLLKAAVDALIRIGEASVQSLIELLSSEYFEQRKFAAYALGRIRNKRALSALAEALKHNHGLAREAAGRALLQIDPGKAKEIVSVDSLIPMEERYSNIELELKIQTEAIKYIQRVCGSLDNLGPPSEYKLSRKLYDYCMEYRERFFCEDEELGLRQQLEDIFLDMNYPREMADELVNVVYPPPLCLCGEYLEWKYVSSLSRELHTNVDGWDYIDDTLCVYCNNCKRYFGLGRFAKTEEFPIDTTFDFVYLPRFPKQTELINEEELGKKPLMEYKFWKPEEEGEEE